LDPDRIAATIKTSDRNDRLRDSAAARHGHRRLTNG
jgi:hypothetical protein